MGNNKVYVCFENKGVVDVNAFKLLGASSKETDNTKIGFWGSGLKYAVAVLLRNSIKIKIFSGVNEIKIGTKKVTMRDEEFDVITVNKKETSITTRAGKDWHLWFAIREIYANAIDEGEYTKTVTNTPCGQDNTTRIYVEFTKEIKDIFDAWQKYFNDTRKPLFTIDQDKVYKRLETQGKGIIYRRGFAVGQYADTLYDYDLNGVDINESRVIASDWSAKYYLLNTLKKHATLDMVYMFYKNPKCFEISMLDYTLGGRLNDNWLEAVNNRVVIPNETSGFYTEFLSKPHIILPTSFCKELKNTFGDRVNVKGFNGDGEKLDYKEIALTDPLHKVKLEKAISLISKYGMSFDGIIIKFVHFYDEDTFGQALPKENTILLSEKTFTYGFDLLTKCLIEEYCHIKSGAGDFTRKFQDYIFSLMYEIIERKELA